MPSRFHFEVEISQIDCETFVVVASGSRQLAASKIQHSKSYLKLSLFFSFFFSVAQ